MGKVLVKKVRFVQKESSPQECCNTSERTFSERICTIRFSRVLPQIKVCYIATLGAYIDDYRYIRRLIGVCLYLTKIMINRNNGNKATKNRNQLPAVTNQL